MKKKWHYRLAQWCIQDLADWYFVYGIVAARSNKYESAAESFFTAWDLNPDHKDAGSYYWHAKGLCDAKTEENDH